MTTDEAINIFAQVEQKFVCDGASHDALKEAIRVLADALAPEPEE